MKVSLAVTVIDMVSKEKSDDLELSQTSGQGLKASNLTAASP